MCIILLQPHVCLYVSPYYKPHVSTCMLVYLSSYYEPQVCLNVCHLTTKYIFIYMYMYHVTKNHMYVKMCVILLQTTFMFIPPYIYMYRLTKSHKYVYIMCHLQRTESSCEEQRIVWIILWLKH